MSRSRDPGSVEFRNVSGSAFLAVHEAAIAMIRDVRRRRRSTPMDPWSPDKR